MIVYFSATGNCKYVAQRIAEAAQDTAVSIENQEPLISIASGELFGIVTPTYCWELPGPVRTWLNSLSVSGKPAFCFVIATYGTTPGCTGEEAKHILKKKDIMMDAAYSVKMPDTWTPMFDLSNPEKVRQQNEYAETEIKSVIQKINDRSTGNQMDRKMSYPVHPFAQVFQKYITRTKNFHVEDACISCGLCEKRCPMSAIEIRDKKPVWIKDHCAACLRCLHHCPKFAIQYGNHTKDHGQYRNPHTNT
nr:EFR1 family ferrodoxin [Shuttleworthia satelles]